MLEYLWWSAQSFAPEPTSISAQSARAAAGLVDGYFLLMAEMVFGDSAVPEDELLGRELLRQIQRAKCDKLNSRDMRRAVGGVLRAAADMERACRFLEEAELIRPVHPIPGPGRKAKNYIVNPAVHGSAS